MTTPAQHARVWRTVDKRLTKAWERSEARGLADEHHFGALAVLADLIATEYEALAQELEKEA